MFDLHNVHLILALRAWILHEDQVVSAGRLNLVDIACGDPRMARALDALAAAYRDLATIAGMCPNPELLLRLGPIGMFIHAVTCQVAGTWAAFCRSAARRYPGLPWPVPQTADELKLGSYNELLVFRAFARLSGATVAAIHPQLGATAYRADFDVAAVTTGRSVFVEITMLTDNPAFENRCQHEYRVRLATKLVVYAQLGLELPVVLGYDDLAPRRLETKMHEILGRLALPVPPPQPVGWFDGECEGRAYSPLLTLLALCKEVK